MISFGWLWLYLCSILVSCDYIVVVRWVGVCFCFCVSLVALNIQIYGAFGPGFPPWGPSNSRWIAIYGINVGWWPHTRGQLIGKPKMMATCAVSSCWFVFCLLLVACLLFVDCWCWFVCWLLLSWSSSLSSLFLLLQCCCHCCWIFRLFCLKNVWLCAYIHCQADKHT